MQDDDLTPEWLRGLDLETALENLIFDAGVISAKFTMWQQRASDVLNMAKEEQNGNNDNANISGK